jgi:hypothetical protein
MDWGMFGCMVGLFAGQTTVLLWMMSKLDQDIKGVAADSNAKWMAVNTRMDTMMTAVNARLDQMNTRLDQNQATIIRLLEKLGK